MTPGIGAAPLSAAALDRLGRPRTELLRPPAMTDRAAVRSWRQSVHDLWLDGDPPAEASGHRHHELGGIRCLLTDRLDRVGVAGPVVVYCHGGGYALGSPEVAIPITQRLARGCSIVSVDYRLAPEHPYPAAVDDTLRVYRAVRAVVGDGPVVLAGDSAGANIALSVTLRLRPEGGQGPVGLVLLSPHVDHGEGQRSPIDDPTSDVDGAAAAWLAEAYCRGVPRHDPAVSPLRADLAGLPPMLIQAGTIDTALPQAVRLARRARVADVTVTLDVWDGLWHTWHYHRDLPEADRALLEAARFVGAVAARHGRA